MDIVFLALGGALLLATVALILGCAALERRS